MKHKKVALLSVIFLGSLSLPLVSQSALVEQLDDILLFDINVQSLLSLSSQPANLGTLVLLQGFLYEMEIEDPSPENFRAIGTLIESEWIGDQIVTTSAKLLFSGEEFSRRISANPPTNPAPGSVISSKQILIIAEILEPIRDGGRLTPYLLVHKARSY